MVYCGKPSRGCQMCRTRRIKCDETKPVCNQCIKSRRKCPGYKDEFDLVFRNETQATKRRAQKANRKALEKLGKSPVGSGDKRIAGFVPIPASGRPLETAIFAVLPGLGESLDSRAECHFLANFVLTSHNEHHNGFFDFIPELRQPGRPSSSRAFDAAFGACALGALGNRVNQGNSRLSERAVEQYTKALKAVSIALRDPIESKSDATLAAVLLLGLFEVKNIMARDLGTLAWGSHVEGAIQLVKDRGGKQLQTRTGLKLFIAVRTQMVVQTTSTGKMPINGAEWWLSNAVANPVAAENQRLNIRTAELRAEVTRLMATLSRDPANVDVMLDMIKRAQMVDRECVRWMEYAPSDWRFRTAAWEGNLPSGDYSGAEVYPGRVDVYPDFWIASIWNMCRVSRIILASVIVRCAAWVCAPVDYRSTPEYATAARTVVENINDILASVPFHLGWQMRRREGPENNGMSGFACGREDVQKMLAGYFLTWPLACIYGQDYTTDSQRQYIHGRLKYIGDEIGIKYAHILAQLNVRLPSMLIRRDGLMASPYPMAHDFERLLSKKYASSGAGGYFPSRGAAEQDVRSQQSNEIVSRSAIGYGLAGRIPAQSMLRI